jgi:hypothetical protein
MLLRILVRFIVNILVLLNKAKNLNMLDMITSCTYDNGINLYDGYSNVIAEDIYTKRVIRKSMEGLDQQIKSNTSLILENVVNLSNNIAISNIEEKKVVLNLPNNIKKNLKIKKNVKNI